MSDANKPEFEHPNPLDRGLGEAFRSHEPPPGHVGSVLRALQERAESSLLGVHLDSGDTDPSIVSINDDTKQLRDPSGRYQMIGEIGRGGVGVVFKGRDQDLGRDVAMKVLKDDFANHPEVLARFVEEAQIGGQLQHPGIVPVYELGLQSGERPYFAMKLVKGETLAAILASRANPSVDRRRLLGIFEQVCQTMSYAHTRSVVHRDLKPANIMIGAFGEVQVVDWGFAKVLPKGGVADERASVRNQPESQSVSVIETVRTKPDSGSHSVAGSMFGTPAYMPPEQALGHVADLDQRSDVFGLGAILCEILTGSPPYRAEDGDLVRQAARGELAGAHDRLRQSGADATLIDLAIECLSSAAKARPHSATELAERVQAYLTSVEERAQQAEVRATQARYRQRMTLMAAATIVFLLGAAGLAWNYHQEQQQIHRDEQLTRLGTARADTAATLAEARGSDLDAKLWAAAVRSAEQAAALATAAFIPSEDRAATNAQLAAIRAESSAADDERQRRARDRKLLHDLEQLLIPPDHQDKDTTSVALRQVMDRDYLTAFEAYTRGLEFTSAPLSAVLTDLERGDIELQLASALDFWAVLRDEIAADGEAVDADLTRRLRRLAGLLDPDDTVRNQLRDLLDDAELDRERLVAFATSADLSRLTADGCRVLASALYRAEARDECFVALAKGQELYPDDFHLFNRGAYYLGNRSPENARQQLDLLRVARALRPTNSEVRHRQGMALETLGRFPDAHRIFSDLATNEPNQRSHWLAHLGALASKQGDEVTARRHYADALALDGDETFLLYNASLLYMRKHEWAEAEPLVMRLIELEPDTSPHQNALGSLYAGLGRVQDAVTAYERAIDLDPEHAWPKANLGHLFAKRGNHERAMHFTEQALALDPAHSKALETYLNTLFAQRRYEECRQAAEAALEDLPDNPVILANHAACLSLLGHNDEALVQIDRAIAANDNDQLSAAELHTNRGIILRGLGRKEAIESLEHAVVLDPKSFRAHRELVATLLRQDPEAAGTALKRAVRELPAAENAMFADQYVTLLGRLDPDEAVRFGREYLAGHPSTGNIRNALANALENLGRHREAIELLEEAIELHPDNGPVHFSLGRLRGMRGMWRTALPPLERAEAIFRAGNDPFSQRMLGMTQQNLDATRRQIEEAEAVIRGETGIPDARAWHRAVAHAYRGGAEHRLVMLQFVERTLRNQPELANDLSGDALYLAVRAVGKCFAEHELTAAERTRWQRAARQWLQHLVEATRAAEGPDQERGRRGLDRSRSSSTLAPLRGEGLDTLVPEERTAWRNLWADVDALLDGE
ncbi:MAG: tetratricopeptide repeat protein [bacterium]|nr:tetratricopeptide repeat protein [bacterium]